MFKILVELNITNDQGYQTYREKMIPILKSYGGYFSYDYVVSKVLITQSKHTINRVFIIVFPDKEAQTMFFSNEEYLKIKEDYFTPNVGFTNIISM